MAPTPVGAAAAPWEPPLRGRTGGAGARGWSRRRRAPPWGPTTAETTRGGPAGRRHNARVMSSAARAAEGTPRAMGPAPDESGTMLSRRSSRSPSSSWPRAGRGPIEAGGGALAPAPLLRSRTSAPPARGVTEATPDNAALSGVPSCATSRRPSPCSSSKLHPRAPAPGGRGCPGVHPLRLHDFSGSASGGRAGCVAVWIALSLRIETWV